MRTCIVTGEARAPDQLIRFVRAPNGDVIADLSGKAPGRGAWVASRRAAVETAMKRGAFARSFKKEASAPADLTETIDAGFAKAALSALGMARRTGDVFVGFEKTKAALKDGKAALFITAGDAGEDGAKKMAASGQGLAHLTLFASEELSAALGRENVVHAAIKKSGGAKRFLRAARRLEEFRRDE